MKLFPFLSPIASELHHPPDAGAGAGGDGGASSFGDAGAGAGDQGTGDGGGTPYDNAGRGRSQGRGFDSRQSRGNGNGNPNTGTPYKLTADSLVDLGDGKPVKWSEAQQRYVPKDQHDRVTKVLDDSRDMLIREGQRLDKQAAALAQREQQLGRQPQQQQQQQQDIAEELAGMGILDGATAARVVKQLRDQGMVPLAQAFARQQATLTQLTQRVAQFEGQAAPLTAANQSAQFDDHITKAIGGISEVKGLSQPLAQLAAKHPVIREIASDLWLSYDPKTWTMPEFSKMLSERVASLIALVRADQTAAVEGAREKKRKFFAQGAASHPSGQGNQYTHMNGRDIARASGLFDRSQPTA